MQRAGLPHQHGGDHAGGDGLAEDGGQRHTGYAHPEPDDEHQIQHHVDDAGGRQAVQRTLGVAHSAQQRTAEVVQHTHGHPDEVDLQVQSRQIDDVLRAAHEFQQSPGGKEADKGQQNAADQTQRHGGVHRVLHAALVLCAEAPRCHHIGTQRQADEQVDQQVDERTVGADRRQSRAAGKAADNDHIGGVEQQLQNAGCRQGKGKQNDLLQHGAGGQVGSPAGLCHEEMRLLTYLKETVENEKIIRSRSAAKTILYRTDAPGTREIRRFLQKEAVLCGFGGCFLGKAPPFAFSGFYAILFLSEAKEERG